MEEKNEKENVNLKKKSVKKTQKNKEEKEKNNTAKKQNTNRLADVIVKMEEEANKVKENKKIEDKSLQLSKKQKNEITIKTKQLEKIEEEIKKQTTIPKEKMNKIYLKVFENIIFAVIVLIYFILINVGYTSIEQTVFLTDLKVFSITLIIATICVFEYAYKKESGKYTIHGIELLILSIASLLSIRIYTIYNSKFMSSITSIALLFAIYYVGKSIVIYIRKKREAEKLTNDIHKISKKKRGNI